MTRSRWPHPNLVDPHNCHSFLVRQPPWTSLPSSRCSRLHSREKEKIFNEYQYFLEENATGGLLPPTAQAYVQTPKATKVSERAAIKEGSETFSSYQFWRIWSMYPKNCFGVVWKTWSANSTHGHWTTREKIYQGSVESIRKVMLGIGNKFLKVNGRKLLMGRHDVAVAHTRFLHEIQQAKQSFEKFVHLAETWVNPRSR